MPKYAMYAAVEGGAATAGGPTGSSVGSSGGQLPPAPSQLASASAAAAAASELGSVSFEVRHPLQRVAAWVESRWVFEGQATAGGIHAAHAPSTHAIHTRHPHRFTAKPTVLRADSMEAYFTSLRDRRPVGVRAAVAAAGGGGGGGGVLQVGFFVGVGVSEPARAVRA
jgi:hypothetical protein